MIAVLAVFMAVHVDGVPSTTSLIRKQNGSQFIGMIKIGSISQSIPVLFDTGRL